MSAAAFEESGYVICGSVRQFAKREWFRMVANVAIRRPRRETRRQRKGIEASPLKVRAARSDEKANNLSAVDKADADKEPRSRGKNAETTC